MSLEHAYTVNMVSRKVGGSLEKGMLAEIDVKRTKQIRTEVKKCQETGNEEATLDKERRTQVV